MTKNIPPKLQTMLIGPCQKPTVTGQLWNLKREMAVLAALATTAHFLASNEGERGLATGLVAGAVLALVGQAVRRAKLVRAWDRISGLVGAAGNPGLRAGTGR